MSQRTLRACSLLVAVLAGSGCGSESSAPPDTGGIGVSVTTSGPEPDPNGYRVRVDGAAPRNLAVVDSTMIQGLPAGNHTVELIDVAGNCAVSGTGLRVVTVTAGATAEVAFQVACVATAALRVTTRSDGTPADPDGYTLEVSGRGSRVIGPNQSITMSGFLEEALTVELADLVSSCAVSGDARRSVPLVAGDTAELIFEVHCAPPVPGFGRIVVTVTTTVINAPSPTSYLLTLDRGTPNTVSTSGTVTLVPVATGTHSILLSGLPFYCSVGGFFPAPNPVSVKVAADSASTVSFGVLCLG